MGTSLFFLDILEDCQAGQDGKGFFSFGKILNYWTKWTALRNLWPKKKKNGGGEEVKKKEDSMRHPCNGTVLCLDCGGVMRTYMW